VTVSLSEALHLARQSTHFDSQLLRSNRLGLIQRLEFLFRKYFALTRVLSGRTAGLRLGNNSILIRDFTALGTLQSSIVDVHETIVTTAVFDRRDPMVIDVGANIGQFTNALKLFYPGAHIIAFEPDPAVFKDLAMNTAKLSNIELYNFAIGEKSTTRPFHRHSLSVMSTFTEITGPHLVGKIDLPVKRLDEVIARDVFPDLVKIDVEGSELQALQGAVDVIKRSRFLLVELSLGRAYSGGDGLQVLETILKIDSGARAVKFGRPLGNRSRPDCQDVLIELSTRTESDRDPSTVPL
jgi:FkbM family methyltransferase